MPSLTIPFLPVSQSELLTLLDTEETYEIDKFSKVCKYREKTEGRKQGDEERAKQYWIWKDVKRGESREVKGREENKKVFLQFLHSHLSITLSVNLSDYRKPVHHFMSVISVESFII